MNPIFIEGRISISAKTTKEGKQYNILSIEVGIAPCVQRFEFFIPESLIPDFCEKQSGKIELALKSGKYSKPELEILNVELSNF